jgi:ketosteroid isomerase-like protein
MEGPPRRPFSLPGAGSDGRPRSRRAAGVGRGVWKVPGATFLGPFPAHCATGCAKNAVLPARDTAWAMSEENVEVARQFAEAVQRGLEHDDPLAMFDTGLLADDWEWVVQTPFEGKSVWTGREEFGEFFRLWTGEFEAYSIRFEEPIDAGDDRVVVIVHQRATGKGSGVPLEWDNGLVFELRDGRAVRTTNYPTHSEALEAGGLSE